MEIDLSIKACA